jgi:hypothetical protein
VMRRDFALPQQEYPVHAPPLSKTWWVFDHTYR